MPETPPPKILIRTPNWLGDLLTATGFVCAVLEQYPQSQVDLIVKSGFETLPLPHRGNLRIFDRRTASAGAFGKTLRAENYDLFYVLPPSFSSAWMAFQSKIPERVGYAGECRSLLLSLAKKHSERPRSQHLLKEYLSLLNPQLSLENYPPYLEATPQWVEQQLSSLQNPLPELFIALAPGAIYGPAKQWPAEYFREFAEQLQQFFTGDVLVLGTEADFHLGEKIAGNLTWVQNYCGQTSLTELLAILTKTALLVSNDSGSMHLMSALQGPQIAIFGSTSPVWTGPINPHAVIFNRNLSCSPCFSRTCRYAHYDCLTQIQPHEVLKQTLKIFASED